jgi:hypothetical protein
VLGAVETFLDAVPSAGFFQGAVLLWAPGSAVVIALFLRVLYAYQMICTFSLGTPYTCSFLPIAEISAFHNLSIQIHILWIDVLIEVVYIKSEHNVPNAYLILPPFRQIRLISLFKSQSFISLTNCKNKIYTKQIYYENIFNANLLILIWYRKCSICFYFIGQP